MKNAWGNILQGIQGGIASAQRNTDLSKGLAADSRIATLQKGQTQQGTSIENIAQLVGLKSSPTITETTPPLVQPGQAKPSLFNLIQPTPPVPTPTLPVLSPTADLANRIVSTNVPTGQPAVAPLATPSYPGLSIPPSAPLQNFVTLRKNFGLGDISQAGLLPALEQFAKDNNIGLEEAFKTLLRMGAR